MKNRVKFILALTKDYFYMKLLCVIFLFEVYIQILIAKIQYKINISFNIVNKSFIEIYLYICLYIFLILMILNKWSSKNWGKF